jgi:putative ribosome biogenesis GTPase RsgA
MARSAIPAVFGFTLAAAAEAAPLRTYFDEKPKVLRTCSESDCNHLNGTNRRRIVDQNSASWNRIAHWLRKLAELRRAA